ncbi:Tfp pilus assembly protein PilW [Variovorax sp. PBL-H6]|uniref:PilW family protein n=1 Tax=Variovorax sp. PBL-H6 TaxID=434009 RepID=UPI001316DAC6|nr:PilW family protein [Variovorax sp. PBL-H6]VTU39097.1 Tfp pilus assembly protein PilW [Variovorax sp. PBL-H6]
MNIRKSLFSRPPRGNAQRGFTLIELMVGLVLGMLTTIVISEVMALSEGKKRTLSMGGDAQVNGALSLYTLQREVQMAGYGAATNPASLGCPIKGEYMDPAAPAGTLPFAFTPTLAPVVIEDGTAGAPDKVTILQSRKSTFSAPILVSSDHAETGSFFVVKSSFGAEKGDLMVAVPKGGAWSSTRWCAVFDVTDDGSSAPTDTTLGAKRVPHVSGTSKWNRTSVFPTGGYEKDSYLLNMGTMSHNTYEIDAAYNLQVTARTANSGSSTATALYSQIVNLQAMYGKDTNGDGQVDTYDTTTPITSTGWQQVLAIRIAVVARSAQFEKDAVTKVNPLWDVGAGSTIAGTIDCHSTSKCLTLKIDQVPDWEHYRYKVYDTVVPLRNVLWNSAGGAT